MTFYTYNYITQHSQFNNNVWYVLSFLSLAALLFVSRYRDLIVILFLAVAFLGGMQWNDYNRTKSDVEATSRMASSTASARICRCRWRRFVRTRPI